MPTEEVAEHDSGSNTNPGNSRNFGRKEVTSPTKREIDQRISDNNFIAELLELQKLEEQQLKIQQEKFEEENALLEGLVVNTEKEASLRAKIAALDESILGGKLKLEALTSEKEEAQYRLTNIEKETQQAEKELSILASMTAEVNHVKFPMSLSKIEPTVLCMEDDTLEAIHNTSNNGSTGNQKLSMDVLLKQNTDLKSLCERLAHEKQECSKLSENKLAKMEEKLKIVATLATSHLLGRMGLEARLQSCERDRLQLSTDNGFIKAQDEVLGIKRNMEIRALNSEVEKLRRLLNEARASQRIADDQMAKLVDLELNDSFSESTSMGNSANSGRSSYFNESMSMGKSSSRPGDSD
jgi:hypothetical protein